MALNLLKCIDNKTEIMVFGVTTGTSPAGLGSLAKYIKPTVTNLGIKIDLDLKFDSQIRAVVRL